MPDPNDRAVTPAPETRILKQCTYVRHASEGSTPSLLLSRTMLDYALHDQNIGGLVVSHFKQNGFDSPHRDDLINAASALVNDDGVAAAGFLRAVPVEEVLNFGHRILDLQLNLTKQGLKSVEKAIVAGSKKAVAGKGEDQVKDGSKSGIAAQKNATFSLRTSAPDKRASTRDGNVQRAVASEAPEGSRFLSLIGFFSLPEPPAEELDDANAATIQATNHALEADVSRTRSILNQLAQAAHIEPVGYLLLERLEFTPIGKRRGDLVYSVPLIPHESTRITHREWSRSETEITKLVATSLETATEDVLAEKWELMQSSSTERRMETNVSASFSASGGLGPITNVSASASAQLSSAHNDSRSSSTRTARELTHTASSRAKEEHKVTFKQDLITEIEDTATRELRNDTDHPVRWDYHRLMRVWEVKLYRYGARLTYDIVIPEPGSFLLRKYRELNDLNAFIEKPFTLRFGLEDIDRDTVEKLAEDYRVPLEPAPPQYTVVGGHKEIKFERGDDPASNGVDYVELTAPEGYVLDPRSIDVDAETLTRIERFLTLFPIPDPVVALIRAQVEDRSTIVGQITDLREENVRRLAMAPTGQYSWRFQWKWKPKPESVEPRPGDTMSMYVELRCVLTREREAAWQAKQYATLMDALRARHEEEVAAKVRRRDRLAAELAALEGFDLRKIEHEEIMKNTLRWLLGPTFDFYGDSNLPERLTEQSNGDLDLYRKTRGGVREEIWRPMLRHGDKIRFLHEAIEWHNINYVLYPYFWTDENRWDFKQSLRHADTQHWNFLRAGAARVVLTIRPGFEEAWLALMRNVDFQVRSLIGNDPYVPIADEMRDLANTGGPFVQAANPEQEIEPIATWIEFTPASGLDVVEGHALTEGI